MSENTEGTKKNAIQYLRSTLTEEVLDYVDRVANINMADPQKFEMFFKALEAELVAVATNRKFLVLNTNVIRETHKRVLASDTARMFYMELTTSLRVRATLELGNGEYEKMVETIVKCYASPVLSVNPDPQALITQSHDEKQLAGQLKIQPAVVNYLVNNEWYHGIILCNFFAATILNQLRQLMEQLKNPAANKPNR